MSFHMRRIIYLFLFLICAMGSTYAQTMSENEIISYASQAKKAGLSDADIARRLVQRGATVSQLQSMRAKYGAQGFINVASASVDNTGDSRLRSNNNAVGSAGDAGEATFQGRKVFGRDIFNNKLLTFEPQMNIATPQNYVLGPGDKLIVDVYGSTQMSQELTISPEGDVTVPNVGPVHVSGLTVAAAQSRLHSKMGQFYSSSDIKVAVGQTRTIMVNVMGEVRTPGTYTLSAFSTVFHALYMAGGINDLGTLRNIKVYRNGRAISVIDIYEFILNGRLAGNVRLQDNDVVQVGAYEGIVDISGCVKRPMAYEMRKDESLQSLLRYSGGFTGDAYKKLLRVLRKSEGMKSVYNVEEFDFSNFTVDDGDVVVVDPIIDRYKDMVEVRGAVFRPGMYRLGDKVFSVHSLVETASGLMEEAMTSRAVIRRTKPNRTHEVLAVDLEGIMNGTAADVTLQNEDVLIIPTLTEHSNHRTLTIDGEVIAPGVYEYADNTTIEDLIIQAGGLTDNASTAKIDVSRRLYDPTAQEADLQISKTFSFSLKPGFAIDGADGFKLEPYDIVHVRRSPLFQAPINVSVSGEVAFEGNYSMEQKNQRLSDVIKAAGGVVPGCDVRGARLIRQMNEDEKARMQAVLKTALQSADGKDSVAIEKIAQSDTYTVGIHLDEALANPGGTQDIELMDGDRLVVPRFNHTIRISGEVNAPNTVAYNEGKGYKYYVRQAGGFGNRAKKNHTYIVYRNGTMAVASKGGKIEPGCEVVVPSKAPRNHNNLSEWLGIGTSMASLATMIATIANLTK